MSDRTIQLRLGLGALLVSVILILYGIPNWVSAPRNVSNIVLSPLFWPQVLSGLTGLTGLALLAFASRSDAQTPEPDTDNRGAATLRLVLMGVIMVGVIYGMPRLGMVWTSMLGFLATAFLVRTRHPGTALIAAIAVPLALYFFFAHVAGVAIPQGNFVRLP